MTGVVPKIEREPVYGLRPNENGGIWVPQRPRPRRNRKNEPVRAMTRENRYATRKVAVETATFNCAELSAVECGGGSEKGARSRHDSTRRLTPFSHLLPECGKRVGAVEV